MSYPTYGKTIETLTNKTVEVNKANGWYDKDVSVPEMIALLHSEVSEALEAWRNNEPQSWRDESGKPQGIGSEFADVFIRLLDYCHRLGINLEKETSNKLDYNSQRSYRHGGKRN